MCARDVSQELLGTPQALCCLSRCSSILLLDTSLPRWMHQQLSSNLSFHLSFAHLCRTAAASGTYSLLPFPTLFAFTQGHHLGLRGFRQSRVLLSQFLTASEASLLSCSRVPPRRQPFDHGYRCAVTRLLRPIIATLPRSVTRLPQDSRPPSSPAGPPESAYKESSFSHDCWKQLKLCRHCLHSRSLLTEPSIAATSHTCRYTPNWAGCATDSNFCHRQAAWKLHRRFPQS